MALNISPDEVYHKDEKGEIFHCDPTPKDSAKVDFLENITIMGIVMLIFLWLFMIALVISVLTGTKELGMYYLFGGALLFIGPVFVLISFIAYRKASKDTKENYILFIKVFSDRLAIVQFCGFWKRVNMIRFDKIKDIRFDGGDFLVKAGVRMPRSYRPFVQLAPAATKYPGALYSTKTPVEYLIRIELSEEVEVLNWDPSSYALIKGDMITKDKVFKVRNVVVPMRLDEQTRFKDLVISRLS